MKFIGTKYTGVCQTFGKFTGLRHPGLNLYIPIVQKISLVSNNVQNQSFESTVKTSDDVFAKMQVQVQVQVKPEDTEKAFFMLQDCTTQIDAYVQNIVRAQSSKLPLNKLFSSQTEIAEAVSKNLKEKMSDYGYTIIDTLVTDIKPASEVSAAMNKIYASERLKEAAKNEADANYIKEVRQAEADRDRKILQGKGISGQRLAILEGYETGIGKLSKTLGIESKIAVEMAMKTQYYDTLESIGRSQNAKTLFVPYGDPSVKDGTHKMSQSLRDQFLQALEAQVTQPPSVNTTKQ